MSAKFYNAMIQASLLSLLSIGCTQTQSNERNQPLQKPLTAQNSEQQQLPQICPTPPPGYEKIPGYQVGRVDPALNQQTLEIISPPHLNLGRAPAIDIYNPVQFCGTAKENIVKVRLFASKANIKEREIGLEAIKYPIGEGDVRDGLWFISYNFTTPGDRAILAKGYDKDDRLVIITEPVVFLRVYSPMQNLGNQR